MCGDGDVEKNTAVAQLFPSRFLRDFAGATVPATGISNVAPSRKPYVRDTVAGGAETCNCRDMCRNLPCLLLEMEETCRPLSRSQV